MYERGSADWETRRQARGVGSWFAIGRLRPGVTLERSAAESTALGRLLEQSPELASSYAARVMPLDEHITGPRSRLATLIPVQPRGNRSTRRLGAMQR